MVTLGMEGICVFVRLVYQIWKLKKINDKSKNLMVNTKLTAKQLEETANG